jgi:predicted PurR-regulated permease PerM
VRRSLQHDARLAAIAVVVVGCYQVLHPFIPALLFAAVACTASWPLRDRLRRRLPGRDGLAAMLMTLLLVVLVIGPTTALAFSLADDLGALVEDARHLLESGPPAPPDWLRQLPLVGEVLDGYWHRLAASRDEMVALLRSLFEPAKAIVLGVGKAFGATLVQLALAAFVAFFFYRDGEALVQGTRHVLRQLAGQALGDELLATTASTVTGVVNGIFGTALAQAAVAIVGFLLAGVPAALALGALTFLLSMVPVGPPLVWGGAAAWLLLHGQLGWSVFMVLYGLFAISSIDNVVKPYLISRSSSLPLWLVVLGVFGGIVAYGFIGVFIGPPMLAVGLTLVQLWAAQRAGGRSGPGHA